MPWHPLMDQGAIRYSESGERSKKWKQQLTSKKAALVPLHHHIWKYKEVALVALHHQSRSEGRHPALLERENWQKIKKQLTSKAVMAAWGRHLQKSRDASSVFRGKTINLLSFDCIFVLFFLVARQQNTTATIARHIATATRSFFVFHVMPLLPWQVDCFFCTWTLPPPGWFHLLFSWQGNRCHCNHGYLQSIFFSWNTTDTIAGWLLFFLHTEAFGLWWSSWLFVVFVVTCCQVDCAVFSWNATATTTMAACFSL